MDDWLSDSDQLWIEEIWGKIQIKIASECGRMGAMVPYIAENGRYSDKMQDNIYWWTNGFWPGILWQMYSETRKETYAQTARLIEERFDASLCGYEGLHHDVGFMWMLSAVADYRLTGYPVSRIRGLHAASLLAGRYNPRGRFIRAWNKDFTGRMIVDCMMNLPLLYWASSEMQDPRFKFIAIDHADTCLKYIVREDGSCNHMVDLNPENGDLVDNPRGQGYASGSSWTRGQAWALYGFALSYVHTGDEKYLNAAKKIANYFLVNVQHSGYVPLVDFRMPEQPVKYDTTAGMIAACGLLELGKITTEYERKIYRDGALNILKATEHSYCDWDEKTDGIVLFGTAEYHKETENHVPIIYGDYFFIEAMLLLKNSGFPIWQSCGKDIK